MAKNENTAIVTALASALSRTHGEAKAKRLGVVKRQRKVDIFAFVATLAFGFYAGTEQTLSALRQAFDKASRVSLVRPFSMTG